MGIVQMSVAASLGLLIGAAGIAATAPAGAPLRPLSQRDRMAAHGDDCPLFFEAARSTLVYIVDHDFMIRTGAGRTVCPITDAEAVALWDRGGSHGCAGLRLTFRLTGAAVTQEANDRASVPATLTVAGRGRPWTVRGHLRTQC